MSLPVVPLILSISDTSTIVYNSTELIGTVSCNDLTPRTVYTTIGAVLAEGTPLYTDAGLTSLLVSSTFNYGYQFTTDINGEIQSGTITCADSITVYSDCNNGGTEEVYPYSYTNPFPNGTAIYINSDRTTEHTSFSFVYLDEQYDYVATSSFTTHVGKCRDEYTGTISCSDGTPLSIFVSKDTALQVGIYLYTDTFLTTTLNSTTFSYGGVRYTTGVTGLVTSVFTCLGQYTIYANCALDDPMVVFASAPPSVDGTHLYLDADQSTEKAGGGFVFGGANYSYSQGGGTTYSSDCGT